MPTGIYDRTKAKPNAGLFRQGEHRSPNTEFKKGQHSSPDTEFHKGDTRLIEILELRRYMYSDPSWLEKQSVSHLGQHSSPETEIKRGQHLSTDTEFDGSLGGRNHWNWKGGISSENQLCRSSGEYAKWRKAVFKKDNFICQICGDRGVYFEAHHIKSFAQYPQLRFELLNGVTLCKSCHRSEVMPNAEDDKPW